MLRYFAIGFETAGAPEAIQGEVTRWRLITTLAKRVDSATRPENCDRKTTGLGVGGNLIRRVYEDYNKAITTISYCIYYQALFLPCHRQPSRKAPREVVMPGIQELRESHYEFRRDR